MEALINNIPDSLLYSIGWTIFHSIWIGAIMSVILFVFLSAAKRKSARFRYNTALSFMFGLFGIVIAVFIKTYTNLGNESITSLSQGLSGSLVLSSSPEGINSSYYPLFSSSLGQNLILFLNRNYNVISIVWLLGILIMGIRFTGGLFYTSRLKKSGVSYPGEEWELRFQEIKDKLGLTQPIRFVVSSIAKIPVTIGYLKPYILIPLGTLSGIPANQVEAIIAHELAHIKRKDFLINIIQSCIEILLFYHPAIWWMSSIVRAEREISCDDIAIEYCGEALTYIKALMNISERAVDPPISAVAISGTNNNLLNRIKIISKMANPGLNKIDKLTSALMSIVLIAGIVIVSGFKSDKTSEADIPEMPSIVVDIEEYHESPILIEPGVRVQDTIKLSGTINRSYLDPNDNIEKDAKITFKDGKLTKLIIDGKTIPESEYPTYQAFIDETKVDLAEAIEDLEEAQEDLAEALEDIEEIDFEELEFEMQEALAEIEEIDFEELEFEIQEALKEVEEIDFEEIEMEMKVAMEEMKEIDFAKIELEMQEALNEIEEIDFVEIEKEIARAMEEVKNIDIEKIKKDIELSLQDVKEIDKEKIKKEMEKSLQEIKESLDDIEIDYKLSMEDHKKDIEKQKAMYEKQLVEIQEQKKSLKKEKKK